MPKAWPRIPARDMLKKYNFYFQAEALDSLFHVVVPNAG